MILQPYGTTLAIAVLVGAWVASVEAKRRGENQRLVWDVLPWVLVFGLIGARAYHICHLWDFYRENLVQVLFLWDGGLGIYGALLGGLLGLWVYGRVRGFGEFREFGRALDVIAPGVAIGQAVGRFANFFSQELYGFPTNLPWGIYIRPENRFPGLENFDYFHPLFLYEALWSLLNFIILIKFSKGGQLLTGERFLLYLSTYALGRFFLEAMRIESWMVGGVRVAQVVSVVMVCGSVTLAVERRMKGRSKNFQFSSSKSQ